MMAYALLALSFWRGLGWQGRCAGVAWLLAVIYAVTDEVHQSFVPGRQPAVADVLVFDALGAALGLLAANAWRRR